MAIRLTVPLLAIAILAAPASAITQSYAFGIQTNGNPVTDVTIYSAAGGVFDLYFSPQVIAPTGVQTLSHSLAFDPDTVLILGVNNDAVEGPHVIMFTNDAFAAGAVGLRYNQSFDSSASGYLGHNLLINTIQSAHAGDTAALDALTAFIQGPGAVAAFDPDGSFSIMQFSLSPPPIGRSIPEPASVALGALAMGALAMALRRRDRR